MKKIPYSRNDTKCTCLISLITILTGIAQPAMAGSVYLECLVSDGKGITRPYTLSLNEEASRVTYTGSLGGSSVVAASFTPDKITWLDGDFSLDRASLVLNLRPSFRGTPLGTFYTGKCKLSTVKRAI